MHHGTCVTHVPWCMSGLLTRGGGKNVTGIPGAGASHNFTYLARGPYRFHCTKLTAEPGSIERPRGEVAVEYLVKSHRTLNLRISIRAWGNHRCSKRRGNCKIQRRYNKIQRRYISIKAFQYIGKSPVYLAGYPSQQRRRHQSSALLAVIEGLRWITLTKDPLNSWRNNNVVITLKWRHFDVIASKWRLDAITTSLLHNVSAGQWRENVLSWRRHEGDIAFRMSFRVTFSFVETPILSQ